jgi:hypothetical protein
MDSARVAYLAEDGAGSNTAFKIRNALSQSGTIAALQAMIGIEREEKARANEQANEKEKS